jgi:hypothetical protein
MSKITKTMGTPFKKGDKVICVNADRNQFSVGNLKETEIYTIEKYDDEVNGVFLKEVQMYNGLPFAATRFKKTKISVNYPLLSETEFLVKEIQISYKNKKIVPVRIEGSDSVAYFLKSIWDKKTISILEQFIVLYLDSGKKILGYKVISQGGITGTVIDVRLIMGLALKTFATSIILSHNHPSGMPLPSDADLSITSKIINAAKYFSITVLDHIVVTENSYYSFADNSVLFN